MRQPYQVRDSTGLGRVMRDFVAIYACGTVPVW